MIDVREHPLLKYLLFGSLYFSEGISFALCTVILISYLTELEISVSTATMVSGIAASPYILKFILGTTTDYFIKYGRKPFIIIGGLVGSICIFSLALVNPDKNLVLFTGLFFIGHIGIVFLDVSADAWAIQITKPEERGKVNSAMFSGLFGGAAIGSLLLSYIAQNINFEMSFIVSGFIVILTIIFPLIVREVKEYKKRPKIGKLLIIEFKKKNTILGTLLGLTSGINFGLVLLILPEYMLNVLDLDVAQTGIITMISTVGIILGSVVGGSMADKYGRKITLYIFLTGALVFTALLITANTWENLVIIYTIFGFFQGGSIYSALMALFMDITNPKIGATQFSILTSFANFGEIGLGMFSGMVAIMLGYRRLFLYAAILIGLSILILYLIEETKK